MEHRSLSEPPNRGLPPYKRFLLSVALLSSDVSAQVIPFHIGGTITGVKHATVTLTGPASKVTTSNGYSTYLFQSIPKRAYTIRPSKPGYTFTPSYRAVTGTESEWILHRQNFI